eukprot:3984188-Pleurochrysis_carterae.AAC.2
MWEYGVPGADVAASRFEWPRSGGRGCWDTSILDRRPSGELTLRLKMGERGALGSFSFTERKLSSPLIENEESLA